MHPGLTASLLLAATLVLLFAEVFLPTGGALFLTSMICLGFSIWAAWTSWGTSFPIVWWMFLTSAVLLPPTVVLFGFRLWPHTPMGKKFEPPTEEEINPYLGEQERLNRYLGQIGEAATPLTPSGIVVIHHERVNCFSDGLSIERGATVRVVEVRRNRLIVRVVGSDQSETSTETTPPPDRLAPLADDLDFDLPVR